jgi:anti-sigma-K factor RskA
MSNPAPDEMRELVEEYALGLLDVAAQAQFEAHLAQDAQLRRALDDTLETLALVGLSRNVLPSADLKQRVMSRISPSDSTAAPVQHVIPRAAANRWSRTSIGLGLALAASLIALAKVSVELSASRQRASRQAAVVVERSGEVAARDAIISQLTDSSVQVVTLAATGTARPNIRAYMNRTRRVMMLSASALPSLPAGRTYQLWFIVDGKPLPSRTFRPDSAGRALVTGVTMPGGTVAATAITQEPQGGSPAPTTAVLFMAKLPAE